MTSNGKKMQATKGNPFVEQSEITLNEEMISGVQQEWFRHDITNSEL